MERQDTTYTKFIVKLLHDDGLKEGKSSNWTLFNLFTYILAKLQRDSGILRWAMVAGIEQNCSLLL